MDDHRHDHYYFINDSKEYRFCNSDGRIVGWLLVILAILIIIVSI